MFDQALNSLPHVRAGKKRSALFKRPKSRSGGRSSRQRTSGQSESATASKTERRGEPNDRSWHKADISRQVLACQRSGQSGQRLFFLSLSAFVPMRPWSRGGGTEISRCGGLQAAP